MRYCRIVLILGVLATVYLFATIIMLAPWPCAVIGGLFILGKSRKAANLYAHGTARWADFRDIGRGGMLGGKGLILGRVRAQRPPFLYSLIALFYFRVPDAVACERFVMSMRKAAPPPPPELVRLNHAVHTAIFAPTGCGKGVSLVIPFLLDCPDSCVVIDPKGENARLTADARRKLGHRVVLIDPFTAVTATPDTFNPLDLIDPDSPTALDDLKAIAKEIIVRTGMEPDPHWPDRAEEMVTALSGSVFTLPEEHRSLQSVRELLTNGEYRKQALARAADSDLWGGMLARAANSMTGLVDKELAGVMSTANRHTSFLDTVPVADSTRKSSFDIKDLPKGKMTVYLILPPEYLRSQSALLRMWIGAMLRVCVRSGLGEQNKVHFVLDEAASLGRLEVLEDAVDKYRGYGVRMQFYYQSIGQLKKCWPEGQDQTLLSNTTQVFFSVNDQQTAEYVSNRLGEKTIIVGSGGTNSGESDQASSPEGSKSRTTSRGRSDNWAQQARRLLKPEEVAGLPGRVAITFTPGIPPLATMLVRYYEGPLGKPSRWRRLRTKAEIWLAAACLLGLSAALGMQMTAVLNRSPSHYRTK